MKAFLIILLTFLSFEIYSQNVSPKMKIGAYYFEAWAGTCRYLSLQLVDGTEHRAAFQFK